MRTARSILNLTRLDSSLLVALTVFAPLFARTGDFNLSLSRAMPLLFIAMCTFVANDLDDIERDKINHPERPLPSGHLKPAFAGTLYFACLASALLTTRAYINTESAFLYYALLTLSISYGYIVDCFPGFKSLYVASTVSMPVLAVAAFCPGDHKIYLIAGAVFFFVLGRELCMDFLDRAGDAESFMHKISKEPLSIAAFFLQTIGLLLLTIQADEILDIAGLSLIALLLALAGLYWFKRASHERAVFIMKVQLFVGLCFLL